MKNKEELWNLHCLYNLARYVFLKIESEYKNIIDTSGITLPQLRVLWIVKSFSGISLGEIAKIGSWAPPTVTKMIKGLLEKGLVEEEEHLNKKEYKLRLTAAGERQIEINKQGHNEQFPLYKLSKAIGEEELKNLTELLKEIAIQEKDEIILTYIRCLNEKELKFNYSTFSNNEKSRLEGTVWFYNLLRIFILKVENEHRKLLVEYNLTYPQLRGLWIVEAFPGLISSQLSEIAFWAPSTANLVVKNLYSKELIYKDKSRTKNALHLFITEEGEKVIIKDLMDNQSRLWLSERLKNINSHRINEVNSTLKNVNKVLGNDKVETYIQKTFYLIEQRLFNIKQV